MGCTERSSMARLFSEKKCVIKLSVSLSVILGYLTNKKFPGVIIDKAINKKSLNLINTIRKNTVKN